ncbi:NAD(P)-dependent oxidoreductase [Nonomuraea typhae]|uniref:NAD(P)-dependent oxidoreductase n=1 Tax=Nonomuraea typhae TaxID=2603600 RepID=UPI0012F91169|nr:NAD(P)-dependent oxidoreductase [Nonomuraea typhae]
MKIGFIGLGVMGRPMAGHLVRAEHEVTGHDLSPVDFEGALAGSVAEAVRDADVVITMLPADPQVEAVFPEISANAPQDALYIDFSTITPQTSQKLAQQWKRTLDAPVSGGEKGAIDAVLSIMAGGSAADFAAAQPVFEAVATTYRLVGGPGAGQYVKAANQLVVGGTYALLAEAIVLMEAAGVDAAAGLDVLAGGLAAGRILDLKRTSMLARDFRPGFRIDLHHKDMGIVLDAARGAGVAVPMGALTAQLVASARAQGYGGLDHSALLKVVEGLSR